MKQFDDVLSFLSIDLVNVLSKIEPVYKSKISEIRIRKNMPLIVAMRNECFFVNSIGKITNHITDNSYIVFDSVFNDTFSKICDYSVHSHISTLASGFVTIGNGNRVGVASNAVIKNGEITSVKDIYSLNIRIARSFNTVSKPILNSLFINDFPSIIVAGPPGSGKTTVLREMAKELSSGFCGNYKKVSIIDERGEIAADGKRNVGLNTDVLSYFPKHIGIEIAVRTLSPDIIICDEIATENEVKSISNGFSSGVTFVLSMHISSAEEILSKKPLLKLLLTNEFSYIVLLKRNSNDFDVIDCEEVLNEIYRSTADNSELFTNWL